MTVTSAIVLAAALAALPSLLDGHGAKIPRPAGVPDVIAQVALEHPEVDAWLLAATLDVLGAHESGYSTHPRGLNDHGRSKGFGQTPRASTPDDLLGQVREAARWVIVSWKGCPAFPLSRYATGVRCEGASAMSVGGTPRAAERVPVWVTYQREVIAEYAVLQPPLQAAEGSR